MRRLGCPILFGGGSSRSTTREGLAPRRRATLRDLSPYSSQQSRWRGGAAFWVGVRVLQRLYNHHPRAEGLVREKVPIKRLNCRCPLARRRWRWAVRLRNGFSVGTGATRSAKPPKTERGGSVPNEFAPNLPRSVFRLRRASPPYPLRGTTPRTINRVSGGCCASRGLRLRLRLFSRQPGHNEDAARTLHAGRENRSPPMGTSSGHDHGRQRDAGRRGGLSSAALLVWSAALHPASAALSQTQRARHFRKPSDRGTFANPATAALWGALGGTWRCVATRGKHSRA